MKYVHIIAGVSDGKLVRWYIGILGWYIENVVYNYYLNLHVMNVDMTLEIRTFSVYE